MAASPAPRANYGLPTPPFWEEGDEGKQRQNDVDFDFEAQKKRAEEQAEEAPEGRKVSFLSPFQEKTRENTESPAEAPLNMLVSSANRNRQIRAITKRRRQMNKFFTTLCLLFTLIGLASDNLELGVPGKADQIVDREGYALGYSEAWEQPRWVAYRLTADEVLNQATKRIDNFQPDPAIRTGSATIEDYRGSGYDRGHLAPAADMKWSSLAMLECFFMSNISPQDRACNAGIWNEIENTVRGFAVSEKRVFIVTGPVIGKDPKTIGTNKVAVPDGFYKVVFDETAPQKMIAFYVPNRPMQGKPSDYAYTVDKIEEITGLNFFSKLPVQTQAVLESTIDVKAWNWSKSQNGYSQPRQRTSSENDVKLPANRKEYRPGGQMPVGSRMAAPVCEDWPDTGYWLNTNSNKRHNRNCENYRKTRGYPCTKNEGIPCKNCGG